MTSKQFIEKFPKYKNRNDLIRVLEWINENKTNNHGHIRIINTCICV